MKKPQQFHQISPFDSIETGPYPPNGFLPFEECALGNGDYFGLYWPIGKENEEPLICEMIHDEGQMVYRFSNLDDFISCAEENDWEWIDSEDENEDIQSIQRLINQGNIYLKQNKPEKAIECYEKSSEIFDELSEIWVKIALQYKRLGKELEFQTCIIKSILSNWAFEFPSENAIRHFKGIKPIDELQDHPIFKYQHDLQFDFGGKKVNDSYKILQDLINDLEQNGEINQALLMAQNYAYMMSRETTAFQERYGFDLEKWKTNFKTKTKHRLTFEKKKKGFSFKSLFSRK